MTQFSLSPGFIKLAYTNGFSRTHFMTIPVEPTGALVVGQEPDLLARDESVVGFMDAVDLMVETFKTAFHSGTNFGYAQFWSQPNPEDDPVWIFEYNVDVLGTNAGADVSCLQSVYTFRTSLGHLYKLYFMEGAGTPNTKDVPPIDGFRAGICTYVLGNDSIIRGRDGGYPIVTIAVTMKTNDALRKKFFLDA